MKLSEAQRKWLTHLRDHGPDTSRNRAGWFCRKNGLTEWVYVVRETGETVARSEAEERWPDIQQMYDRVQIAPGWPEAITPAGIKALEG